LLVRQHLALRPTMAAAPFFMRVGATDVIRHMTWHKQRYFKALRYTMDKIFDRGIGVWIEALNSCPTFVGGMPPRHFAPTARSSPIPLGFSTPIDPRPGPAVPPSIPRSRTKNDRRDTLAAVVDGGAGNRTLVRIGIPNCVYVRRRDFMPSLRAGNQPTFPKPISKVLTPCAGASRRASPDFRFGTDAPGGLRDRRSVKRA